MPSTTALWRWTALGTLALVVTGCSQEVQEDRSINYSRDGDNLAFQHGDEGVFVADGEGGKLQQIFDCDEDTIAVSSPLWSPVDQRLIFTAARSADSEGERLARGLAAWDANPEGRQFQPEDVEYTCLMRPEPTDDEAPPPVTLFEASCNHPGYVAANLAVRWHPRSDRVLFIDRTDQGRHGLFEFDLASKNRRQLLRQSASGLIFDWTPGGSYLACVLVDDEENSKVDGVWIRPADETEWWKVPRSENLATGKSLAPLERARATRPAWTDDDRRFAFVVSTGRENDAEEEDDPHAILVADVASHEVTTLYEGRNPIRELHWCPESGRLGFVEGDAPASLRTIDPAGAVSDAVNLAPVRRFAGWNHDGTRLAYVTPEPAPDLTEHWALLFTPVRDSRDHVYVADGAGSEPGRVVHSGVRITFPQWSPKEDSLSLWGTYTPTHRSWLSMFLPLALNPGDPAAVLDCRTGEMKWMAVNAHEKAQVGHYYLLKRDYDAARVWYEQSAELRPPVEPIKIAEIGQFIRRLRIHQDPTFFEYHCLTKLARHEEAAERLRRFRQSMRFDTEDLDGLSLLLPSDSEQLQVEIVRLAEFVTPLMQSSYMTEVYLSLDAAADGVAFFRHEFDAAATDAERLACALCLSQLLLVIDDRPAYADLAMETLAPLLLKMHDGEAPDVDDDDWPERRRQIEQLTLRAAGGLALLPMMSDPFLGRFSEEELRVYLTAWRALRDNAKDDTERLVVEAVLFSIAKRLGDDDQRRQIEQRIRGNPQFSANSLLDDPDGADELIEAIREYRR